MRSAWQWRDRTHLTRAVDNLPAKRAEPVNAGAIVLKTAEVKFLSSAGQAVALAWSFFGGLPRRFGIGAGVGGAMMALERTCSGMSSACCRSR